MLMCQCANGAALCLRWRVLMPQGISTLGWRVLMPQGISTLAY